MLTPSFVPPLPLHCTRSSSSSSRSPPRRLRPPTCRYTPGPILRPDHLNDSLQPDFLQRHRHVLAPDEAFAAIFSWEVVAPNTRHLERAAWLAVAEESNLPPPDFDDILRAETMPPHSAVSSVFYWTTDWSDINAFVYRKHEFHEILHSSFVYRPADGLASFLNALTNHGIKTILCTAKPLQTILPIIQQMQLDPYFPPSQIVSADDSFDSLESMFLIAAVKADRPPEKCVVFTDMPVAITAAHDVTSKVVALIGPHPAYHVKTADQTVPSFDDLVVYNIRRLFSETSQYMQPQLQTETEEDPFYL